MPFEKGQSGNPAGRPPGVRNKATILLQNLMDDRAEAIARKVIDMAAEGNIAAIRMCLDRLVPVRRQEPIAFEFPPLDKPADSVTAATTIVSAVAAGELAPSEASELAKVIAIYLRALEATSFEERLAKLEAARNDPWHASADCDP